MEPFVVFRLFEEPHAATTVFVIFESDRNIVLYYLCLKKPTYRPTGGLCITLKL